MYALTGARARRLRRINSSTPLRPGNFNIFPIRTPKRADPTTAGGFPSWAEIVDRYAEHTGRDVSRVAYYTAFSSWRLAVIIEGVYARYIQGAMVDDTVNVDSFRIDVEQLAASALDAVRTLD